MSKTDFTTKYLPLLLEKPNRRYTIFLMGDFNIRLIKVDTENDNS